MLRTVVLVPLTVSTIASAPRDALGQARGERITTRHEVVTTGDGPAAQILARSNSKWTATIETLRGRMRLDVIEGSQPGVSAGQYTLSDSADVVTIYPASKTFMRLNFAARPQGDAQRPATVPVTRTQSIETFVDSAAAADSATGTPVMRYTVRIVSTSISSSTNAATAPPGTITSAGTKTTTTYQFSYPVGAPTERMVAPPQPPPIDSFAAKTREAFAKLPPKRSVHTVTTNRVERSASVSGMPGEPDTVERRTTMRLVARDTTTLDETRFVIPEGYTERPNGAPSADAAWLERWRKPPV